MIVGLFTEVLANGGVQRAGRHVAAVVSQFGAQHATPCQFLSLNDPQGRHQLRVGSNEFSVFGYARNKARFALAAFNAAGSKPYLVIALHPHLAPVVSCMRARYRESTTILFAHGIEVWKPLGWMRGAALRQADLIIAPSADTVQHLISDQKIPSEKTRRLAWGLDPEFEARLAAPAGARLPAGFPQDARIILAVGRWDPAEQYKGADTLIASLPLVLRSSPDVFLVLVGEGKDQPRLEHLARDQGVSERTRFLHNLTMEELFACYAKCDVFALPSRGEGFGFVFLEAMAHGKPLIGGAHGGAPDLIEDGLTGWLVPHGNVGRLSVALNWIFADPERAGEMGERGRQRLVNTFSFDQFRSRLLDILNDVPVR